jgi:WD40 repeat protein
MGLKETTGRFEDAVAVLYRMLGFEVKRNQTIDEIQIELLTENRKGGIATSTVIECHEKSLDTGRLDGLIDRQKRIRLHSPRMNFLVVTSQSLTDAARKRIESAGIEHITYPELLREVIPMEGYIDKRMSEYEKWRSEHWDGNDWFIRPDVITGGNSHRHPALEEIAAWLGGNRSNLLALLGDVGTGKTTLAGFLAYEMAKAYKLDPLRHPAPVLIELQDVRKETSLESIVISHFRKYLTDNELNDFSISRFEHLVRNGKIVLLFDAFDEMAERMRPEVIWKNLNELIKPSRQGGKVFLTCRTHYFKTRDEQEGYVGKGSVYLQEFTNDQVRKYLFKARPKTAEEDWTMIQAIYNLKELVARPLLLDMVVETMRDLRVADASALYKTYADNWFNREQEKGRLLNKEVKLDLMKELAWQIYDEEKHKIHFNDLLRLVERLNGGKLDFHGEEFEDVAEELRTASFLKRDADGNYEFADRSFGEYFLACKLHDTLSKPGGISDIRRLLRTRRFEPKVIFFLSLLMKKDSDYRLQQSILSGDYESNVSENALQILYWSARYRLDVEARITEPGRLRQTLLNQIPRGARLSNASLKGMALEASDLSGVDLSGSDLTEANLNQSNLQGTNFRGAVLTEAKLEQVSASGADFRETQLSRAVVRRSDVRDCDFTGAIHRDIIFEDNDTSGASGLNISGKLLRSDLIPVVQQTFSSRFHSIAFGPGGEWYATGNQDGLIAINRIGDDRLLLLLEGHRKRVHSLHFSPSDALLVSGGRDGVVRLWSVSDGRLLHEIEGHRDCVRTVRFSPDGKLVASGSDDRSVRIWMIEEGRALRSLGGFEGHTNSVNAVHFSPDGKMLATAGSDGTVRIWDVNGGHLLHVFQEGEDTSAPPKFKINAVQFSPDSRLVASTDADNRIRVRAVGEGKQMKSYGGNTAEVTSICFSPDGQLLVSGGKDLRLRAWSISDKDPKYESENHSDLIDTVWFSSDGRQLMSGSTDRSKRVWAVDAGRLQPAATPESDQSQKQGGAVRSVALSADGRMMASGGDDKCVYVWSACESRLIHTLAKHRDRIRSVDFSPDGRLLASGGEDQLVRIWSAADGQLLHELEGHDGKITSVHFSPGGKLLVSASEDKSLRLWLVGSGEFSNLIRGTQVAVNAARFSPDGRLLAAACEDNGIWLWSSRDGQPPHVLRKFEGHTAGVSAVRFFPDGIWLLSGAKDNTVRVWNVATGHQRLVLEGHTERVSSVALSPDGSFFASGSLDGSVRIWRTENGQLLRTLTGHLGEVYSLAITRNSKYLIAAGFGGRLHFWNLENGECCLYRYGLGDGAWLDLLPDGRFDASAGGKRYLCYTEQGTLISHSAETLLTEFYHPDAVRELLEGLIGQEA